MEAAEQLRRMADQRAQSDGELLAASSRGEESAFAGLVERHGPLVYNACLRVLRQVHAAEDATQAVFLALAHKAGERKLQSRASLAGWLYRTAWHVSLHAKEAHVLQEKYEREAGRTKPEASTPNPEWEQIRSVLDREVDKLPEKFRVPIVLHHLQGQSAAMVGTALQCSEQAIKHRLVRGREMLRERLLRAGVSPQLSAGSLASLIAVHASSAGLSPAASSAAAKSGGMVAMGKSTGAAVSANVKALANGALKTMVVAQLKSAALVFLAASACTALSITAYRALGEDTAGKPAKIPATVSVPAMPSWPGWRGAHRNGLSDEVGFNWTKEGPKKLWSVPITGSCAGVTVSRGRLFYGGAYDPKGNSTYQTEIGCLDAKTGKELWKVPFGVAGPGATFHSTLASDDTAVYGLNNKGWVGALNAADGKVIWEKNLVAELQLKDLPGYGIATSPLVVRDILVVGGTALDKKSGKLLWSHAFSSIPSTGLTKLGDKELLLCIAAEKLEAINATDGKTVWAFNRKEAYGISPANPCYIDPLSSDGHIIFVSGYGGAIIGMTEQAAITAKPEMDYSYSFAQLTLVKGFAYGGNSGPGDGNITGKLACVDVKTGKKAWEHNEYGATHLAVDGKLVIQTLAGELIVAEASPDAYTEISRIPIIDRGGRAYDFTKGDRPIVTAPAFCDGRIYCRVNGLTCFEVERKKETDKKEKK